MPNELATITQPGELSAQQVASQVQLIQQVMREVMINGEHYGTIPGCGNKPALLKPGAEKLAATFGIVVNPVVEDLSTPDCFRYRVTCHATSKGGLALGGGVGECSTDEDKYRWRGAVCDEEWAEEHDADPSRTRSKWRRSGKGSYQVKQVRTNPSDLANTVLKMAKKRAMVDCLLTCTAASDIFSQVDDLDGTGVEPGNGAEAKPEIKPPRRKSKPKAATPAEAPATPERPAERHIITNVEVRTGTSEKGDWTRYGIWTQAGKCFGTFSDQQGQYAQERIGQAVAITYTQSGKFLNVETIV